MLALLFLVPLVIYTGTANANMIKVTVFNLGILFLAALWIVGLLCGRRVSFPGSSLKYPVLGIVLWSVLSALLSKYKYASCNELGKQLAYVFFALIISMEFDSRERIQRLFVVSLAGYCLTCVYGLLQHFGIDWIDWYPKEPRILSSFGNPTFFAAYLVLWLPMLLSAFLSAVSRRTRWVLGFLICLGYVCTIYTYTRAAWLGWILSCLVYVAFALVFIGRPRLARASWVRSAAVLAGVLVLLTFMAMQRSPSTMQVGQRLASSFQTGESSNVQRIMIWRGALGIFRSHPVLGTGIGTFQMYLPGYLSRQFYSTGDTVITDHAHNEFLEVASETGIVGLSLFLWLMGGCVTIVVRALRKADDDYWRFLALGTLCGLLAFMVQNLAGVSMRWVCGGMFFWVLLALLVVVERVYVLDTSQHKIRVRPYADDHIRPLPVYLSVLLVFAVVLGAYLIVRPFESEVHLKNGNTAIDQSRRDTALHELLVAVDLDPYSLSSYYKLGHVYNTLGRFDDALNAYTRLETLSPDYARVHYNIGAVLTNLGKNAEAVEEYAKAVSFEDSPRNHMALAEACVLVGHLKEAIAQADIAVRIADRMRSAPGVDPVEMYLRRGRLYSDLGRIGDSMNDYRAALRMQSDSKLGHFYLANCYGKHREFENAIREYETALRIDPQDARVYTNMGVAYYYSHQYERALACYRLALNIDPKDAYAHLNMGLAYLRLGRMNSAERAFGNAIRLGGRSRVAVQAEAAVDLLGHGH